ncbi:MAG: glutathione S-transferase family protein [Alphaproteobacteria bacterium]|nr:glutathione S-transferase family protein [Alphaproteobacteria bacterium]
MFKIWGRADGSNVVKAMWCVGELGVEHERIDWGGRFGGNDDPEYREKNPNGRLPTLEEEGGFTVWESGPVVRYLCSKYSMGNLYPEDLRERASADKWMDWSSLNLANFNGVFLDHFFRLPEDQRDPAVVEAAIEKAADMYAILDKHLANRPYLCGDKLTTAEFPAGSLTYRWMTWPDSRPSFPNVEAWYERLAARPAYQEHVIKANRKRG